MKEHKIFLEDFATIWTPNPHAFSRFPGLPGVMGVEFGPLSVAALADGHKSFVHILRYDRNILAKDPMACLEEFLEEAISELPLPPKSIRLTVCPSIRSKLRVPERIGLAGGGWLDSLRVEEFVMEEVLLNSMPEICQSLKQLTTAMILYAGEAGCWSYRLCYGVVQPNSAYFVPGIDYRRDDEVLAKYLKGFFPVRKSGSRLKIHRPPGKLYESVGGKVHDLFHGELQRRNARNNRLLHQSLLKDEKKHGPMDAIVQVSQFEILRLFPCNYLYLQPDLGEAGDVSLGCAVTLARGFGGSEL